MTVKETAIELSPDMPEPTLAIFVQGRDRLLEGDRGDGSDGQRERCRFAIRPWVSPQTASGMPR